MTDEFLQVSLMVQKNKNNKKYCWMLKVKYNRKIDKLDYLIIGDQ